MVFQRSARTVVLLSSAPAAGTVKKLGHDCFHNLLTPWSRVLLEKLTGFQLVKNFPSFYRTRRFITAVTGAPRLSLS